MSSFDVTFWHEEERTMKEGDEREKEKKTEKKKSLNKNINRARP